MMNDTLLVALIVSVVAPTLLAVITNRFNRQQKKDEIEARQQERRDEAEARLRDREVEWRRQDEVAARLSAQQDRISAKTSEAIEIAKHTAVKIDGVLADRDKANVIEGETREAARGKETAAQLREGQLQGQADERASMAAKAPIEPEHKE